MKLPYAIWCVFQTLKEAFYLEDREAFLKTLRDLGKREDFYKIETGWVATNGKPPTEVLDKDFLVKLRDGRVRFYLAGYPLRWTSESRVSDIMYYQFHDYTKLPLLMPFYDAFIHEDQVEFDEAWRKFLFSCNLIEEDGWLLYTVLPECICPVGNFDFITVRYRDGMITTSTKAGLFRWSLDENSWAVKNPTSSGFITQPNPIVAFKFVEAPRDRSR